MVDMSVNRPLPLFPLLRGRITDWAVSHSKQRACRSKLSALLRHFIGAPDSKVCSALASDNSHYMKRSCSSARHCAHTFRTQQAALFGRQSTVLTYACVTAAPLTRSPHNSLPQVRYESAQRRSCSRYDNAACWACGFGTATPGHISKPSEAVWTSNLHMTGAVAAAMGSPLSVGGTRHHAGRHTVLV